MTKAKNNFFNVVYALFLRDIQTRFGSKKMGYFWAIVEPSVQIAVFLIVKIFFFQNSLPGIEFSVFLASGFITYNLFKNIILNSLKAFESNKAIFIYSQVKPIHCICAKILIEFLIFIFVTLFFLFIGWYMEINIFPDNLLELLLTIIWLIFFSSSLALLFSIITYFYESLKKVLTLLFTPLFFLSALFYTVDSLPSFLQQYILINPLAHFMELIHACYINKIETSHINFIYLIFWTIIPLYLSLYLYIKSERKIQST